MGFFDDLAMGVGLKDRDDDYYERTAQTLGRESQGGSAQREAQYRGSMGMNNGATVGGGQLDKRGGLLPFMEGGGTIGAIARGLFGMGGGKTEQASNSPDLGLGGWQSFLGTRGPAAQSELGNAQMQATLTDNLPGYFDPATREYVPWYVDIFNGGGFNSAGGEDAQAQAALPSAQASASPRQISPQARPVSDPRNLGGSEGYGPMGIDPRNLGGSEGYGPMGIDPRNLGGSEGYGQQGTPFSPNAVPNNSYTDQALYSAPPASGILSPPAEAAPTTSSEDSFLDRLLSGEIAALNRATLDGDVETEAFVNPTPSVNNNVQPELRDSVINDLRKDVYTTGPVEGLLNWLKGDSEGINSDQQIKDYQSNYDERQRNMPYNPKYGVFYNEMKNSGADINNPDVFDQWLKQRGL